MEYFKSRVPLIKWVIETPALFLHKYKLTKHTKHKKNVCFFYNFFKWLLIPPPPRLIKLCCRFFLRNVQKCVNVRQDKIRQKKCANLWGKCSNSPWNCENFVKNLTSKSLFMSICAAKRPLELWKIMNFYYTMASLMLEYISQNNFPSRIFHSEVLGCGTDPSSAQWAV